MDSEAADSQIELVSLCNRILDIDPAIRVAAIIDGTEISGFASRLKTGNQLVESHGLKEKIGYLARFVTEVGRETEPLFGSLESVSIALEKLKLVTIPVSTTRSIGMSVEKSVNPDLLASKIKSGLDLNSRQSLL